MESTLQQPTLSLTELSMSRSKAVMIGFWISTALFCLQMGFTVYAPPLAAAAAHRP